VADSVTLRFSGAQPQAIADESWGIDNVRVTTGSAPRVSVTSPNHEAGFTAPASPATSVILLRNSEEKLEMPVHIG